MAASTTNSLFSNLSLAPPDSTYALVDTFNADNDPKKVSLLQGVYRDDNAKPWILNAVKNAEDKLQTTQTSSRYEYLPITGHAPFHTAARTLLFGPSTTTNPSHIVSLHTVSGTGANHIGARFLSDSLQPSSVWISDPSWVNHENIWKLIGVEVKVYPYWNAETKALDFDGMVGTLEKEAKSGDVIVLHACAHNPTGLDLSKEQWEVVAGVCERRGLFPFFDAAYQGFASGDLDQDAWAVRHFVERGTLEIAVAQSFSKNLGLYGERVGALHLVTASADAASKAKSHLARIQRGEISGPPAVAPKIATEVMTNPELFEQWLVDLKTMSSRIKSMRKALFDELTALGTPGNWDHVVSQIGMFSYTGLTEAQVADIQKDHHVYMLKSGRMSIAGLNTKNVAYVAQAIDGAVRMHL